MRFLGIGDYCDLSSLYLRLLQEGHQVKIYIAKPLCRDTLAGLVDHTDDWRTELPWIREAGDRGMILFENAAGQRGKLQDELRGAGYHVIGGSAYGDRLENDRAFAQAALAELALSSCPVHDFQSRESGVSFLRRHPGRYVLKFNGPLESYVGRLDDGRDVLAYLTGLPNDIPPFILMHHVEGIEVGIGAYFNGEDFLTPSCLDWEHKRFFPGDLGEMTGEMGTIVTYERTQRFHELTLERMAPLLRESGYCGYINLNTIVNDEGVWPLEFTCRFGYPGYAILESLQETPWGELFHSMVSQRAPSFITRKGFAAGIVITTPPFPYARPDVQVPVGLPVLFDDTLTAHDRSHFHYGEVGMQDGQLVTTGAYGWTMVVTGTGSSVQSARDSANHLAERVIIPNARYRRDIGDRLIAGEYDRLERLRLLDPVGRGASQHPRPVVKESPAEASLS